MNIIQGIVNGKCPRCRNGNMFKYPVSNISRFSRMHEKCTFCELVYTVEPGFFIGAMYISYTAVVGLTFVIGMSLYILFDDPDVWVYAVAVISTVIILLPFIFRFSRILYLYWFGGIRYDPLLKPKNC